MEGADAVIRHPPSGLSLSQSVRPAVRGGGRATQVCAGVCLGFGLLSLCLPACPCPFTRLRLAVRYVSGTCHHHELERTLTHSGETQRERADRGRCCRWSSLVLPRSAAAGTWSVLVFGGDQGQGGGGSAAASDRWTVVGKRRGMGRQYSSMGLACFLYGRPEQRLVLRHPSIVVEPSIQ